MVTEFDHTKQLALAMRVASNADRRSFDRWLKRKPPKGMTI